jgi:hypothetical protein
LPQIIAWGNTLADPPLQHIKGDTPAKHFPMISVYDGWQEDVGRVVVDSTWHHWFNMNIDALEAEGGEEWDKVSRYFVNVAKWIAPKGVYRSVCWWDLVIAHLHPITIEELHPKAHVLDLGSALYDHLAHIHGPCTVRNFILESICDRFPVLCEGLRVRYLQPKLPNPCWSCPPIDVLERIVLGGMARGTMDLAQRVRDAGIKGASLELSVEEVQSAALQGMDRELARFGKEVLASADDVTNMFRSVLEMGRAS